MLVWMKEKSILSLITSRKQNSTDCKGVVLSQKFVVFWGQRLMNGSPCKCRVTFVVRCHDVGACVNQGANELGAEVKHRLIMWMIMWFLTCEV